MRSCRCHAVFLFYIARQSAHCCHSDNCPVCAVLTVCESILRELSVWIVAAAALIAAGILTAENLRLSVRAAGYGTPVSLKVKLLD